MGKRQRSVRHSYFLTLNNINNNNNNNATESVGMTHANQQINIIKLLKLRIPGSNRLMQNSSLFSAYTSFKISFLLRKLSLSKLALGRKKSQIWRAFRVNQNGFGDLSCSAITLKIKTGIIPLYSSSSCPLYINETNDWDKIWTDNQTNHKLCESKAMCLPGKGQQRAKGDLERGIPLSCDQTKLLNLD